MATPRTLPFLFIAEDVNGPWTLVMPTGEQRRAQSLAERAPLAPGQEVIAILPGQSVGRAKISLPKLPASQRRKAAEFAAEDAIASALKDVHLALGAEPSDDVLSVERVWLEQHLAAIKRAGLSCQGVYADFEVWPEANGAVTLEDRVVQGGPDGYTLDGAWAEASPSQAPQTSYEAFASALDLSKARSFLQGAFARRAPWRSNLMGLGRAAALLLCLGAGLLVLDAAKMRALSLQTRDLNTQSAEIYEAVSASQSATPARDLARSLAAASSGGQSPLDLCTLVFKALENADGVELRSLQYDAARRALSMQLSYPSFESAAEFEAAVKALGGALSLGGVREQGGALIGEAVLAGEPA